MKHLNKMKTKQHGFTLIELMVVLLLIGLVSTWVGSKALEAWEDYKVTRFIDDVNTISKAVNQKYGSSASYSGASMSDLGKRLPDSIDDGVGTNPWGGNYSVTPGAEPRTYIISGTKLQERAGLKVEDKYTNATFNVGTESIAITFGQ